MKINIPTVNIKNIFNKAWNKHLLKGTLIMKNSFFINSSSLQFIKYAALPILSLSALSATADEYQYDIELDESAPYIFEDDLTKTININLGKQFTQIDSVCLEGIVESGRPNTLTLLETSEPVDNGFSFTVQQTSIKGFPYFPSLPTLEEPTPSLSQLENFEACFVGFPNNFNDGQTSFDLTFTGDNVQVTSLNLVINGELNKTNILTEISTESDAIIESTGGPILFNIEINNEDIDFNSKKFRIWSHITFPNGDIYPVKKSRGLRVQYQETKAIDTHFFVPGWFEAGEYKLTTYVADKLNGERITSSFNFTKLSDTEKTAQ